MINQFALSVIGRDKPGIVAGITECLYKTGCNILESSMTILASEFAMILLITSDIEESMLNRQIAVYADKLKLSFYLKRISSNELKKEKLKGEQCIISVYGADKPGIVYKVSKMLAKNNINISDVQTNVTGPKKLPVYIMMIEATLPENKSFKWLQTSLKNVAKELSVTISANLIDKSDL